jgi:hypothetical protein
LKLIGHGKEKEKKLSFTLRVKIEYFPSFFLSSSLSSSIFLNFLNVLLSCLIEAMQTDTISRLQNMSSVVKIPSPLSGKQQLPQQQAPHIHHQSLHQGVTSTASTSNLGQLDNIFQSVKRQVN